MRPGSPHILTINGGSSTAASRVVARVIHTDEERMIAETVCRVLGIALKREN